MVLAYSEWGVWSSLSNFRIYLSPQKVPFISHSLFLLLSPSAMKSESESRLVMFDSLWPHGLYSLWNSPGQTTGAGSCSLLQGIFPTQGLNPGLSHYRQILYHLSHQGSPLLYDKVGLIPVLGWSPGERNGYPLQNSCLKNSMDWAAWWATVYLL